MKKIDAAGLHYRPLNEQVRAAVRSGEKDIRLVNVNGQRFIGDALQGDKTKITIDGVPGNDLAVFMDGPTIVVNNNAEDGVGNTMNAGKVIIHGDVGDVIGYGMRGGIIHIKGNVGYRIGLHMKEYETKIPVIIAGGTARDFYGEYMAGGVQILLGLNSKKGENIAGHFTGTGMHGGLMYIRGGFEAHTLAKEASVTPMEEADYKLIRKLLKPYCKDFDLDLEEIMKRDFTKLAPPSARPYGGYYAY
jgi:glutamate synthase domain-containing protein 3